ncbi:hypothetical protein [Sulfurimonas sp.]|uniref:hypothetical protein n=1 Tax=Sulfurimonas sp. TaxID=2022749 RepID=UPI003D0971CA
MRFLQINDLEIHLQGDQAFLYSESDSDVLNIENIEFSEEAENLILEELRLKNKTSLMDNLNFSF